MTTQLVQSGPLVEQPERESPTVSTGRTGRTGRTVRAPAAAEVLVAAAAIVLAIIGLAGVVPVILMSIATIAVGAAQLMEANVDARGAAVFGSSAAPLFSYGEDRLGLRAERLGGALGIALGILALIGLIPVTLCSVALIGFGGALLLGSLARRRVASMGTQAMSEGELLAGSAAVVLGYLALIGFTSVPLVLAGLLGVASAFLLSGCTCSAYVLRRVA